MDRRARDADRLHGRFPQPVSFWSRMRCSTRAWPSADYAISAVWVQLSMLAADLLTFFAALCLDGPLAVAGPKTIRYRLLHVAGRLVRHARRVRLRIDWTCPWADQPVAAFQRLAAVPAPAPT